MPFVASNPAERTRSALGAILLTGAMGYLLIAGLAIGGQIVPAEQLQLFDIGPEPPPPPPEKPRPQHIRKARPKGAASPPNLRSEATEIVVPPPAVPLPAPIPIVVAPIADTGAQASSGSADIAGPGTGAGGFGNGRGSGGDGDGDGSGGDETPPRQIRGDLRDSDYPREAVEAGVSGTVGVRYTVWTDGRVPDCEVEHSSGSAALDDATCRLIRQRFRFRPSRDGRGRPVPATIVENHSWVLERAPPDPEGRRRR